MTTAPTTALLRPPLTRDESAALLSRTMGFVAATAGAFALGAYLGRDGGGSSWIWFLPAFGTLLALNAAASRSEQLAIGLLLTFGLLLGVAVAPTLSYYVDADPRDVWTAGAGTALFIGGFGAAGYTTRPDLSRLGRQLSWALLALIGFGVVLIFVQIPGGALVYSLLGLAVFAGLTAFDFQRLRRTEDIRTAPLLAASIFLDVLNVFLLLLSFSGSDQ